MRKRALSDRCYLAKIEKRNAYLVQWNFIENFTEKLRYFCEKLKDNHKILSFSGENNKQYIALQI